MQWIRHNWLALVVLAAIAFSFFSTLATVEQNDRDAFARTVNTCQRANPSRAYLQLRATEFTQTTDAAPSFTTEVAPWQYAILNCEATVREDGQPVPVSPAVEQVYLEAYKSKRVLALEEGEIVLGTQPFSTYFGK